MSTQDIQILELAKQGLTAAEIAEALGYSVEAIEVKLKLDPEMNRALQKADVRVEVNDMIDKGCRDLTPVALRVLKELLVGADKDSVRLGAVELVLKQQSGMMRPKEVGGTINVNVFNDRLQRAREQYKKLEEQSVVDVESAKVLPV